MYRRAFLTSLILLVISAVAASAAVTLTYPTPNQTVGPSTEVRGYASQRAFLVIYTNVYTADDREHLGTVPGIRHWTARDGSFRQRIATPRAPGQPELKLLYEIVVKAFSRPDLAPSLRATPDLGQASVWVRSE